MTLIELNRDLHFSVKAGSAELVRVIIAKGADKESKDSKDLTPIQSAASCGHASVVAVLLQAGADMEAKWEKNLWRPLHLAAAQGHVAVVEMLLDAGAEVNAKMKKGARPLHLAASYNHAPVVEMLIRAGADKDARDDNGSTPLHSAAIGGHVSVVEVLLKLGANKDLRAPENVGVTPRDVAENKGHASIVALLDGAAITRYKQAVQELGTMIMEGIDVEMARAHMDQIEKELKLWEYRSPSQKRDLLHRKRKLFSDSEALLSRIPTQARRDEFTARLAQLNEAWHNTRMQTTEMETLAQLREQVDKIEKVPEIERRTLLQKAKRLLSENPHLFEKQECDEISRIIAVIRKSLGARWWQFWL